jgi:hypothetical protein
MTRVRAIALQFGRAVIANREIDAIPLSPDLVMVRLDRTNVLPRTVLTDVFMPMAGSSPAKTFPSPEGRPTGRCGTRNDKNGDRYHLIENR